MLNPAQLRSRLEAMSFPDLGAMMEGYARAAVDFAAAHYRQKLDYSGESIDRLDEIVVLVGENPDADLEFEVRLWGSYLGEVLRRRYAGGWEMTTYPGPMPGQEPGQEEDKKGGTEATAVPAVEVRGSRLFPLMKVYRRLTMGDEDDLRSFYTMVTGRLGSPARVN